MLVVASSSLGIAIALGFLELVAEAYHLDHLEEVKLDCKGHSKYNNLELKEAFIEGYYLRQDH